MCNNAVAFNIPAALRTGYDSPAFAQITKTTTIKG
jgi:hypothetical protein